MDLSLRQLEQAVSIRRQIDVLERRFAGLAPAANWWGPTSHQVGSNTSKDCGGCAQTLGQGSGQT